MITYQQTDSAASCFSPTFTGMGWLVTKDGTPGSTEVIQNITEEEFFDVSDAFGFEVDVGNYNWDGGTLEIDINVTTFTGEGGEFGDIEITGITVQRVNSSCSVQETVGSASLEQYISSGINSFSVNLSESPNAQETDKLIVSFDLRNWAETLDYDLGITPNRTIVTPFTEAVTEIQVDVTDSVSGSDNVSVIKEAQIDTTEQATGQDSVSVNIHAKVEDSGTFSESEHINVNFLVQDLAESTDDIDILLLIFKHVQDSFSATDGASKTAILLTIEDEVHGSEDIKGQISVIIEDNAQFTDQTALVLKEIIKRIADNAQFIDSSPHLGVEFTVSDNGAGSDAIGAHIEFTVTDQANAADNIEVITDIIISILDSGSFSDEGGVDTVGLSVKDSATLSDEIGEANVYIKATESAQFQDEIAEIANMLAIIEEATATDAVIAFEEHSRILEITFQLKQKMTIFNLTMKSMDYMLKYKKMEFEYAY